MRYPRRRMAGPKDLIWSGSVQWETGPGSPTYAYVFGLDEKVVQTVLQHIQRAVVDREFTEDYQKWVEWLGQSRITSQEEIWHGIEESIRVRGPSRHQMDEMWMEGASMSSVLEAIEQEPLVIDLVGVSFEDLSPYCSKPEALQPFILDVSGQQAFTEAATKESQMTRRNPEPRRRTMRRRADAQRIRDDIRERLERRAEAQARREPPRRVASERVEEMRRERRREERLARLEELRRERLAERAQPRREERLARLEELRRERRREERIAQLEEDRRERRREERLARLEELRAARAEKPAAKPERKAPAQKTAETEQRKRIYVKADNSAGVPAGYYELDEQATRLYQAHLRREAAAKRKPSK